MPYMVTNGENTYILSSVLTKVLGKYKIGVAEFAGVDITITKGTATITSKVAEEGKNIFDISEEGTYTVTVSEDDTTIWTANVTVDEEKTVWAKGRVVNNLTWAQIHQACQGGYAQHMFSLKDRKTFVQSGSLFNNQEFYIQHFFVEGGKTQIQWGMVQATSTGYAINPKFYYFANGSASSSNTNSSEGGYKYSNFRLMCMRKDDEPYTQCQSLKQDGSSATTGIAWSDYKYSDTKQNVTFYTYTVSSDAATATESMTQISAWQEPSQETPVFVKGYWKNVGKISEADFNAGYFYTYESNVYTPASTYSSSTTYYGFYEKLQEDGTFYAGISSISDYLAPMELKQSCGKTRKKAIQTCVDYVTISSLGELMGQYLYGSIAGVNYPNYYGDPIGCNEHFDGCDGDTWYTNRNMWTRSVCAHGTSYFCYLYNYGYVSSSYVSSSYYARPGFRTL